MAMTSSVSGTLSQFSSQVFASAKYPFRWEKKNLSFIHVIKLGLHDVLSKGNCDYIARCSDMIHSW